MRRLFKKHLLIIFAFTSFALFLSGSINDSDPKYSNADLNKYIAMAEASPGLNLDVIRPFVYRIGAPWVAGLLPFPISTNFYLLNLFALLALSYSFYFFLIEFGVDKKLSLIMTIIFQLNKYFFLFLAWNHFQLSDTLSLAFLFYSFILLKRRNFKLLFLFMIPGVLIKEYSLMIIPAGFAFLYEVSSERRSLIYYSIISVLSVLVFVLIRVMIISEGGESLFTQYSTQVIYYSTPELLAKRFIIPFTPFGLLPVLFLKELIQFFKEKIFFFIYALTIIFLSFFGEPERLIEPLAPIYYLFIASLIQQYIMNKPNNIIKNRIIFALVSISFLASFYHLWGIITLPNELYSIISTISFTIVTSIIFYFSKRPIKNNSEFRAVQ